VERGLEVGSSIAALLFSPRLANGSDGECRLLFSLVVLGAVEIGLG